jgi:Ca2+-binding EF-hand superfamily protein
MVKHEFTNEIINQIEKDLNVKGEDLIKFAPLLEYINIKTKSANKGSKARGSFANLYAIYVLLEDYVKVVFEEKIKYSEHQGAVFSELFKRQRELPFGAKLQNHALNHRLNEEYHKYFPTTNEQIILRDIPTSRYWINKNLIIIKYNNNEYDLSKTIIKIIDHYINVKRDAFDNFIRTCEELQRMDNQDKDKVFNFIMNLLDNNADARLFEIASYSILKYFYHDKKIFWGYSPNELKEENLKLYKTGRTNANDGGIDFVMRPLGYFFQVTETLDIKKYFLDIDKLEHYPIRFVIKTNEDRDKIYKHLRQGAYEQYGIEKIVNRYMESIEDVVNIPQLITYLNEVDKMGCLNDILNEILIQSKIEFNYLEEIENG